MKPDAPATVNRTALIDENIEAIADLINVEEEGLSTHQRSIERIMHGLAVPRVLYILFVMIALWIGVNTGIVLSGGTPFDRAPFAWLQMMSGLFSLTFTLIILITQNRQGEIERRNAHLDLQINMLVDRRTAKIVQLLEEMRTDMPNLINRVDKEAEGFSVSADPKEVADLLADKMGKDDENKQA